MGYKLVKKADAAVRRITENKTVFNYITKEFSPNVSLAVVENKGNFGEVTAEHDRIYYVIDGELDLRFSDESVTVKAGDACLISGGTTYGMSGDCKVLIVDQPAFGS